MTTGGKKVLLIELEEFFGEDRKRINHAKTVLKYAELILKGESGDNGVVVASAILHDVGIKEAERKYGSSAGNLQEKEWPPIARKILEKNGGKPEFTEEVCRIIGNHHSPGKMDSLNFKILLDADLITNLKESNTDVNERIVKTKFFTETGRKLAARILLKDA